MWRNYFRVIDTYMKHPFWCWWIPTNIPQKHFCDWWRIFNSFVSTCAIVFRTTYGKNTTRRFDTEGFVPVDSLYGVVGPPSCFTKFLIGRTGNMWSVVYIIKKCICLPESWVIVCNVCHVNSTYPFIYWWYGAANVIHTALTEIPSWNSLEVNCVPASV